MRVKDYELERERDLIPRILVSIGSLASTLEGDGKEKMLFIRDRRL